MNSSRGYKYRLYGTCTIVPSSTQCLQCTINFISQNYPQFSFPTKYSSGLERIVLLPFSGGVTNCPKGAATNLTLSRVDSVPKRMSIHLHMKVNVRLCSMNMFCYGKGMLRYLIWITSKYIPIPKHRLRFKLDIRVLTNIADIIF